MSRLNRGRKAAYHHGDLRRQLIGAAIAMVRADGIESLTLRKLAERVGVSQTALYHHFGDKQDLLCAMGEEGIHLFEAGIAGCFDESASPERRLEAFVQGYVRFALGNPELYELMFGRTTWRGMRWRTCAWTPCPITATPPRCMRCGVACRSSPTREMRSRAGWRPACYTRRVFPNW